VTFRGADRPGRGSLAPGGGRLGCELDQLDRFGPVFPLGEAQVGQPIPVGLSSVYFIGGFSRMGTGGLNAVIPVILEQVHESLLRVLLHHEVRTQHRVKVFNGAGGAMSVAKNLGNSIINRLVPRRRHLRALGGLEAVLEVHHGQDVVGNGEVLGSSVAFHASYANRFG